MLLSDVTVLSLEHAVAAPFATRQLADLGARVIKVERPGSGDFARQYDESVNGESSYFVWLNRSKESVALDVKSPEGRAILDELAHQADVIVQNLGPGAAARLGLSATDVRAKDPRKIVAAVTGWGSDGPWADRKAYDLLVQCETGLVSLTGTPETGVKAGVSIADIAAGMYTFSGILAALYRREVTGEGATIEVSLFEALAEWMGAPAYYTRYGGRQPARVGAQHATIAPYGPYGCADGRLLLAVQNDREWRALCTIVLGDPAVATDPRFASNSARVAHREELDELISGRLAPLTTAVAAKLLDGAGVAHAGINRIEAFLDHPVLAERERWHEVAVPGGTVAALRPPVDIAGVEPVMGAVPALGAHTDAILRELGHSSDDVADLRERAVV